MNESCFEVLTRSGIEINKEDFLIPEADYMNFGAPVLVATESFEAHAKIMDFSKDIARGDGDEITRQKVFLRNRTAVTKKDQKIAEILSLVLIANLIRNAERVIEIKIKGVLYPQPKIWRDFIGLDDPFPNPPSAIQTAEKYGFPLDSIFRTLHAEAWEERRDEIAKFIVEEYSLKLLSPGAKTAFLAFKRLSMDQAYTLSLFYPQFHDYHEASNYDAGQSRGHTPWDQMCIFEMPIEILEEADIEAFAMAKLDLESAEYCWHEQSGLNKGHRKEIKTFLELSNVFSKPSDDPAFLETLKTLSKTNEFPEAIRLAEALNG